jgi:micrococcal nuclease
LSRDSNRKTYPWRRPLIFSLVLLTGVARLLAAYGDHYAPPPKEALVVVVIDGDTLVLAGGRHVRLLSIDAPEMERDGHPADFLAHKAKAALSRLTLNRKVDLEYGPLHYDHYGRLLAYLFLPDHTLVNAVLVRRGLARVYFHPPNWRYREVLLAAQQEAIEARRGIWPRLLQQDEPYYVGNRRSLRLHRPECPLAARMSPANRVRFTSLKKAFLLGYSPCRSCKP